MPDQVIDRTKGLFSSLCFGFKRWKNADMEFFVIGVRPFTFFEKGIVGHVGFADPFDEKIAKIVRECGHALEGEGIVMHDKGTIICMGLFSPSLPTPIHPKLTVLSLNRRTRLLHPRRIPHVPQLGWFRNQHVRPPRSQARA